MFFFFQVRHAFHKHELHKLTITQNLEQIILFYRISFIRHVSKDTEILELSLIYFLLSNLANILYVAFILPICIEYWAEMKFWHELF